MQNKEIWKELPGSDGLYEASNTGRIRSVDREESFKNRWGEIKQRRRKGRILAYRCMSNSGYHYLTICSKRGHRTTFIHRLVWAAFNNVDFYEKFVVNHKNGVKTDNRIENLESCTYYQNSMHSRISLRKKGKKLNLDDVIEIIKLSSSGMMTKDIAKKYGIVRQAVSGILTARWWPSKNYPELEQIRRSYPPKLTHKKHQKECYP